MSRSKKDYLFLALKGIAIGAGEFIPGFTGATVAFITGIYSELLDSIGNLRISRLKILFKSGFFEFWKQINGTFLLIIFSSIILSLVTFSFLANYLFTTFPISTWSFLFGVLLFSIIYIMLDFKEWNYKVILAILVGISINIVLTFITPLEMSRNTSYLIIVFCAFIAAFAIYFPGLSVSLVFVLLGQYEFVIKSVSSLDKNFLLIYYGSFLIFFILNSRLFAWIIKTNKNLSISFLTGLLIGSLYKLWPWKHALLSHYSNQYSKILPIKQENVFPNSYFDLTAKDPQTLYAILMVITGFLVVYLLHNTFSKKTETHE